MNVSVKAHDVYVLAKSLWAKCVQIIVCQRNISLHCAYSLLCLAIRCPDSLVMKMKVGYVEVESRHGFCWFSLTFVVISSSLPQNFCIKRNIITHTMHDWLLCNVWKQNPKQKTSSSPLTSSAFSSNFSIIFIICSLFCFSRKLGNFLGSFGV